MKFRLQKAWEDAKNNLIIAKTKQKGEYDKYNCKRISYNVGDRVLIENRGRSSKMETLFVGHYLVTEDKDQNIVVKIKNKNVEIHKNRVKRYFE